ncbi:MAG TPA: CRISPR-associated endonuclease Cas2 [Bacillota bacterium]|nr:CRISPR-associated endonuclease Cas2 [Bacillota bacterium]
MTLIARRRYLVCYDIRDAKRLRRVFKCLQGFGDGLQYSVFYCELSPRNKVQLEAKLGDIINHKEDRVMIVDTGAVDATAKPTFEFMGQITPVVGRHTVII